MNPGSGKDTTAGDFVVPLHSRLRRRAQNGRKLEHLIPAAGLLFGGVQSLIAGGEGLMTAPAVRDPPAIAQTRLDHARLVTP